MLDKAREVAVAALSKVQETQKRAYNKKRQESPLTVGDVVWLREGHVPKEFNRKTFAPMGGPYRVTQVHGDDHMVVDIEHLANAQGVRRVNVERLMRVNRRDEPELSEAERQAAGIPLQDTRDNEGDCPLGELPVDMDSHLGELPVDALPNAPTNLPTNGLEVSSSAEVDQNEEARSTDTNVYEVRRIWAHRQSPEAKRQRQYLVEWEIPMGRRLGTWVKASDITAKQAVNWYWTSFQERSLPVWDEPKRKTSCQFYGYDAGCEHLQCRYPSWRIAMQEAGYWAAPAIRKSEISGGSDVRPDTPAGRRVSTRTKK